MSKGPKSLGGRVLPASQPQSEDASQVLTPSADAVAVARAANDGPVFRPFGWIDIKPGQNVSAHLAAGLACNARDIAAGVAVVLEVLEQQELDRHCADADGHAIPPMFSDQASCDLMRLAIASLRLLSDNASRTNDQIDSELRREAPNFTALRTEPDAP